MTNLLKTRFNLKVTISSIVIFIFIFLLLIVAYLSSSGQKDLTFTFLICLFGSIIGWLVAMVVTPYGQADETSLKSFSKIIGSFLTGYVLSKLDKIIETFINNNDYTNELILTRLMLFVSFFFLFWILVFNYRRYVEIYPKNVLTKSQEKIDQLNKWRGLLDSGQIIKEDYDSEKEKILKQ
jgi:hypothetical protein